MSGLDFPAAEFFIGHSVEKLGYDKSPEVYPEYFRAQFIKVEPALNVFSNQNLDTKKLGELEEKVQSKEAIIDALIQNGSKKDLQLASLTERLQNIEASKSGIEALLTRVLELEKKLGRGDEKA